MENEPGWWIVYHDGDVVPPAKAVIIRKPEVFPGTVVVCAASSEDARAQFKEGARGKESLDATRGPSTVHPGRKRQSHTDAFWGEAANGCAL